MQALKVAVIVMGVLLVGGSIALAVAIVARSERRPAAAHDQAAPVLRTELPATGRIVATALAGDRLLVRVALADGGEELVLFNARTGAEVAVITLHGNGSGKAAP
jgi:hypothetical protein